MTLGTYLLYAKSNEFGNLLRPVSYISIARMKNRMDLTASPARHFSPASSNSTPAGTGGNKWMGWGRWLVSMLDIARYGLARRDSNGQWQCAMGQPCICVYLCLPARYSSALSGSWELIAFVVNGRWFNFIGYGNQVGAKGGWGEVIKK